MKETTTIESQFKSLNGGIEMWLPRFADCLVDYEIDELIQKIQEASPQPRDRRLQEDLHFLSKGVKSIDKTVLENVIAPLRESCKEMEALSVKCQQRVEYLRQAESRWTAAAERAKSQLEVWENWAYEMEDARSKKFPHWSGSGSSFILRFKFYGGTSALSSAQQLRADHAFFKSRVDAIQNVIFSAYIDEELPNNQSSSDFDEAIETLYEHQSKVNELLDVVGAINEKLESARRSYSSLKIPLLKLLWLMPETARWALFRICRPDLRIRDEVEQSLSPQSS